MSVISKISCDALDHQYIGENNGLLSYVRWSYVKFHLVPCILDKQEDSSDDDEAEEGEVEDENSSDIEVSNRAKI